MSRFSKVSQERLELGDGDWVDVRTRLTYGDRAQIEAKLLRMRVNAQGRLSIGVGEEHEVDNLAGNVELLLRAIVAWGGSGFCELDDHPHEGACRIRAVNGDNIEALDATAERILEFIRARSIRGTPDFTQPLSPDLSTGEAGPPPPPDAPASSPSANGTDGASES